MQQLGQYDHIKNPTRISKHSSSILDKIYSNIFKHNLNISFNVGILELDITDHMPTFININIPKQIKSNTLKSKIIYKLDHNRFIKAIKEINWDSVYECKDVNECYDIFIEKFEKIHKQSTTIKTHNNNNKEYENKWLTKSLKNAIKKKFNLYKIYIRNKTMENELRYKNYKKRLKNILKKEKYDFYQNEIDKCTTKTKYWNIINNLTGMNKTDSTITKIKFNNKIYNTDIDIANSFNSFFSTIGTNINESFNNNNVTLNNKYNIITNDNILNKNITSLNTKNNNIVNGNDNNNNKLIHSTFYLSPISEIEIMAIINDISSKKSKDINNIDFSLIKIIAGFIIKPLHYILNLSFTESIFPDKMKIAIVLPIYKKLDKLKVSSYRPISILPQFSKILEKLIHKRMYQYIYSNNLLNPNQFGFIDHSNTMYASAVLTDFVSRSLDRNFYVSSIFLDLEKAFDTVDHTLLLYKLNKLGFRGHIWKLLKSYLTNRYQCVKIDSVKSSLKKINVGVPQGSILGPLFFILFINDIFIDKDAQLILFADDTSLTLAAKDKNTLENKLNMYIKKLKCWFDNNKLKLNLSKTKILNYDKDINYTIILDNKLIENVKTYKFLGVYLDHKLNYNLHISKVISKISKIMYMLKRVSKFLNTKSLILLYNSLILPHFIFSIEIWGTTFKYNINKLFYLQKKL